MFKMKTFILSLIVVSISIINLTSGKTDYCKLCKNHIACNNKGTFAKKCFPDSAIVKLTKADKDYFVKVHNELRNQIASGKTPGYKSAANMSAVVWDNELAYLAELNTKQCNGHDACRKTEKYPSAGQNLASAWGYNRYPALNSEIKSMVTSWFDEYKESSVNINKCCQMTAGHFTQVVQYRVVAIGCAVMRYTDTKKKWMGTEIACNYSFGNLYGSPVYIPGKSASSCKKGKHPVYKSLCK